MPSRFHGQVVDWRAARRSLALQQKQLTTDSEPGAGGYRREDAPNPQRHRWSQEDEMNQSRCPTGWIVAVLAIATAFCLWRLYWRTHADFRAFRNQAIMLLGEGRRVSRSTLRDIADLPESTRLDAETRILDQDKKVEAFFNQHFYHGTGPPLNKTREAATNQPVDQIR